MEIKDIQVKDFEIKEDTLSLYKAVKDNPKDKIEVEIGDSKDLTTFQPQAKIMRWDNEVNLSIRYKDDSKVGTEVVTKEDAVEWVKQDREVHIYEKPEVAEDGGLEIEVVLKEKPISNVIEFSIETKGLDFFYQPELTQEEKDDGAERPENVVGSYTVYHKDTPANYVGGKEYKVGKMCHIFRPKVVDAKGNEIWGELNINIEKSLLTVTIDEKWLEKAIYPVIVDPTFGYTTAGSSQYGSLGLNVFAGSLFTSPSDAGEVTEMSANGMDGSIGTQVAYYKGLIVLHSDLSIISNGVSSQSANWVYGTSSWKTVTFTTNPTLSPNTDYLIGAVGGGQGGNISYDAGDANQGHTETDNNYSTPTNPSSITHNTNKYSIYATYTEASSGTEADSERGLYTKGKTTSSSDRNLYTKGKVSSSSERGIHTIADSTSSSDRVVYTSGNDVDSSERAIHSIGGGITSSERGMYTNGVSTSSSEKDIYTKGTATSSSERSIHSIGGGVVSSERAIHTLAEAQGSSQRGIYTKGTSGAVTKFYWYNGSSWVLKNLYRYNGSSWVAAKLKRFNGSTWEDIT